MNECITLPLACLLIYLFKSYKSSIHVVFHPEAPHSGLQPSAELYCSFCTQFLLLLYLHWKRTMSVYKYSQQTVITGAVLKHLRQTLWNLFFRYGKLFCESQYRSGYVLLIHVYHQQDGMKGSTHTFLH